ncbi:MAG: hypothetical protein JNL21_05880 [Myxococcales bacterium]|nr:hypothetical protein [Myxococcales bacterium]
MFGAELATLYVGPDHAVSIYRNLIIFISKGDPLPETVTHLPAWLKKLQRECKEPIGMLVVLRPENPLPKEEVRVIIKQIFGVVSGVISFLGFVVEKEGFAAAAQRSVLNMVMLASRPPFPMKVFGTVSEVAEWMCSKYGQPVHLTPPDLMDVVARLTAAYNDDKLHVTR